MCCLQILWELSIRCGNIQNEQRAKTVFNEGIYTECTTPGIDGWQATTILLMKASYEKCILNWNLQCLNWKATAIKEKPTDAVERNSIVLNNG